MIKGKDETTIGVQKNFELHSYDEEKPPEQIESPDNKNEQDSNSNHTNTTDE